LIIGYRQERIHRDAINHTVAQTEMLFQTDS